MLCEADNTETGAMWECPLLLELTRVGPPPKPSQTTTTGGIKSIHDSHTDLPTPSGQPVTFQDARNMGAQTDKAVESEPGNLDFGRSDPQPVASTSTGMGGLSKQFGSSSSNSAAGDLSKQFGGLSMQSRDSAGASSSSQQPQPKQQPQPHTHFLCISPDAPTNPVLYWLGAYDSQKTRFIMEGAKGPLKLDLGDIMYAPNLMIDGQVGAATPCLACCCLGSSEVLAAIAMITLLSMPAEVSKA